MTAPSRSPAARVLVRQRPVDARFVPALRKRFPQVEFIDAAEQAGAEDRIESCDVSLGGPWNSELLQRATALRWIQSIFAGTDDLPLQALRERGIRVTNFRGVSAVPMSEHVLSLMLAFARGLPEFVRRQQSGDWRRHLHLPPLFELQGQAVGILGLGTLGTAVADLCHRVGMHVMACVRSARAPHPAVDKLFPWDRLDEMLAQADHLVLVLPSNEGSRGLMDAARLRSMRRGAYLYNVGRGDAVDPAALLAVLEDGHLAGAGLDVTSPEPLPSTSPLWSHPRVLITGHSAGISPQRWRRGADIFEENLRRYLAGEDLLNPV